MERRTTKTVERIARAISIAQGFDPDRKDHDGEPAWKLEIDSARAAIREMKAIEAGRVRRRETV